MRGRNVGEKRKFKLQVTNTVISNKYEKKDVGQKLREGKIQKIQDVILNTR
jgi:predicted GNAT family acetyltransferase